MAAPLDPTFRNYNPQQAAKYAAHRGTYASPIIEAVVTSHASHGGEFGAVWDIGCGPGNATRSLAEQFDRAGGCDPSKEMIARAKEAGGQSRSGKDITYEVLDAERLDQSSLIAEGSVDLLTAAMAAHWFNMSEFWAKAMKMVKPGGSIALWTVSSLYCHPSTPNAEAVQRALSNLEDGMLGPYELPQNRLSRRMYDDLPLPWTIRNSDVATAFSEASFVRHEWNRDGKLEPGQADFLGGSEETSLASLASGLSTASMVTRWREAHPDLVDTDKDCVAVTIQALREALGTDETDLSRIRFKTGGGTVLLMFTRS